MIYNGIKTLGYARKMPQDSKEAIDLYMKIRERAFKFFVFGVAFLVLGFIAVFR